MRGDGSDEFVTKNINNIVFIRPGALGDVLVARGAIRFLRDAFPEARLTLLAPGERGRLFLREGWAHRVFDWDGAAFGWLFSRGESAPDARLCEAFSHCDLLFSFVDAGGEGGVFSKRLAEVAPNALRCHLAPHPSSGADGSAGARMLHCVAEFSRAIGAKNFHPIPDIFAYLEKRMVIPFPVGMGGAASLLVMHPGSGSPVKNWPVGNFASLAVRLLELCDDGGERIFHRLVVTHGEADGELGEELCRRVEGAIAWPARGLEELGGLLAGALFYVGNDSGVSHLASAVCGLDGAFPKVVTVFGASDAVIWAPPGALVLDAGKEMDELSPDTAFDQIARLF